VGNRLINPQRPPNTIKEVITNTQALEQIIEILH